MNQQTMTIWTLVAATTLLAACGGSGNQAEEAEQEEAPPLRHSDEIVLQEMVVQPGADILGRSASDIALRTRFGINLLAISRQGHRSIRRRISDGILERPLGAYQYPSYEDVVCLFHKKVCI